MSRQTLAITTISINIPIVMPRVIYDRVRNRKNYFEIPAFLPIEQGISKREKFIIADNFQKNSLVIATFSSNPFGFFVIYKVEAKILSTFFSYNHTYFVVCRNT